jgi:hypothetical protein
MSASQTKTNNDDNWKQFKIDLRLQSLPDKKEINVLECYGGEGILWNEVKKLAPGKKIKVLSMDKNKYKKVQLQGNNEKFIRSLDVNKFDLIDLDAWGNPFDLLEFIINQGYSGVIHITEINSTLGCIKNLVLNEAGITSNMYRTCQTIFKSKQERLNFNYLYSRGIKKIIGKTGIVSTGMVKNYYYFNL